MPRVARRDAPSRARLSPPCSRTCASLLQWHRELRRVSRLHRSSDIRRPRCWSSRSACAMRWTCHATGTSSSGMPGMPDRQVANRDGAEPGLPGAGREIGAGAPANWRIGRNTSCLHRLPKGRPRVTKRQSRAIGHGSAKTQKSLCTPHKTNGSSLWRGSRDDMAPCARAFSAGGAY